MGSFALLLFVGLAFLVSGDAGRSFDDSVLLALRLSGDPSAPAGPSWMLYFIRNLTALGGWPLLTLLSVLLTVFLVLRRRWLDIALLFSVLIGQSVIVSNLKKLFARERPDVVPHLYAATSYSFPSGHAASATAFYLVLAVLFIRTASAKNEKIAAAVATVTIVFLVGFSRIYLGVHYPTDVMAGWSFGAGWACLVLAVSTLWEKQV